jgi:hypothetical protein
MKYKNKLICTVIPSITLALVLTGCALNLGASDSSANTNASESDMITDRTAYSRKMDGSIFNWHDNGCSYELDDGGNVTLSYDNGAATAKTPLALSADVDDEGPKIYNTGFFISDKKTAIAYKNIDSPGSVTIITSGDKGKTWETANLEIDSSASWIIIGFMTREQGWLIICGDQSMGAEKHSIYTTSDGGETWISLNSDIDKVYSRILSGAGFISEKVGFLCFRYETDFQPAVCMTGDGGLTWDKVMIDLPAEYDHYNMTPLSPIFDDEKAILPILLSDDSGDINTIYLKSIDCGTTWVINNIE